jgi:HEAT repeat protein
MPGAATRTDLWTHSAAAAAILDTTHDPDPRVRWTATWMLGPESGEKGEAALVTLLFDPVRMVRQPATWHLKKRGREDLVGPLEAVTDYELDERLGPLGRYEDPSAEVERQGRGQWIRNLAEHKDAGWRATSAFYLGHAAPGADVTEALLAALRDDDEPDVRRWAAWALGRVSGTGAHDALASLPLSEDPRVRVRAAAALAEAGDDRGVRLLSQALADDDHRGAAQAAEALGSATGAAATVALLRGVNDPREVVRAAATAALAGFRNGPHGAAVDAALRVRLADESALVRAAAAAALAR